jgi:pimeloyl-ACP methyl ester carboxylesterase
MVQARGRTFRTVRAGGGTPLVVFDSGLGTGASAWAEVQRQVAARTATLSYDRAGLGGSTPVKDGRRLTEINADLEAVLDTIGYDGPVVLVGQSWGGPVIRAFSHHTRRRVAGLVLVDGTKSGLMTPEQSQGLRVYFGLLGKLSRVGLHRKLRTKLIDNITSGMTPADGKRVIRDMASGKGCRGGAEEAKGLAVEVPLLADLEARGFPEGAQVTLMAATVAEKGTEDMRARFVTSQADEAEAGGHRLVVVTDSRHDIHMHQPTLVADEVIALVESARTREETRA